MVPDVGGSMNLRHPNACAALEQAARTAGAQVHRGTRELDLRLGPEPVVRWRDADGAHEVQCRMVVGADGRASRVRKALGLELERAPVLNHIAGLLISDLDIDNSADFIAGEGDLFMAGFHQEGGRARVYLCPGVSQAGPSPAGNSSASSPSAPSSASRSARSSHGAPAGPWPPTRDDTWTDRPFGPGAVLVINAAGYSNPIVGQGLSSRCAARAP
jgi:flavin-dependent dehydrogenase